MVLAIEKMVVAGGLAGSVLAVLPLSCGLTSPRLVLLMLQLMPSLIEVMGGLHIRGGW